MSSGSLDPEHILHLIKFYAVEVSSTIVFLRWIVRALWRELHLRRKWRPRLHSNSQPPSPNAM